MTVSVIIPAYNCESFVRNALDSVRGQTHQVFEVIVVDDGSTDGTAAVVKEYLGTLPLKIISQENSGVASARNAGLRASNGEYIAFLDADDVWARNKIEKQIEFLDENPDMACYCAAYGFEFFPLEPSRRYRLISWPLSKLISYLKVPLVIIDYVPFSSVVIPRYIVDAVGFFDPRLSGTEDWEYLTRVQSHCQIGYVGETSIAYRVNPAGLSSNRVKHTFEQFRVIIRFLADAKLSDSVKIGSLMLWGIQRRNVTFSARVLFDIFPLPRLARAFFLSISFVFSFILLYSLKLWRRRLPSTLIS